MHPNTPYVKAYKARNKANGLCVTCGKPRDTDRSVNICSACLDKVTLMRRSRGQFASPRRTSCKICEAPLTGKQRAYCSLHSYTDPKAVAMLRFKLTSEQFDSLGTVCSICGSTKRLVIDHDHVTGYVRGRLCTHCNNRLGKFEVKNWFAKMIEYVQRPQMGLEPIPPKKPRT